MTEIHGYDDFRGLVDKKCLGLDEGPADFSGIV